MVDYIVESTTAPGGTNKGSFFIRGVKNEAGDAYKFVLEKNTDFHDLDVEIVLKAYEESFRNVKRNVSASPPVMGAGGDSSRGKSTNFLGKLTGQDQGNTDENSPIAILEKHSCTVFLPDVQKEKLDWDYLAGY